MLKADLRKKYKEKRRQLIPQERADLSRKIFENFTQNFNVLEGSKANIFLSSEQLMEVDTSEFIHYFFNKNCKVFVPKVIGNEMMAVEISNRSHYQKNQFGIDEPEVLNPVEENYFDFVIVPLLYCDGQGNRVGYGKGFYDKFFSKINGSAVKIGLNFFKPEEEIEDASAWDVRLDYLVLPETVLSFGSLPSKFTK